MKTKLIKFFNLIKKDKQAKILTIMGIILLFIFTLGYSLSMFTSSQNNNVANIKVNDLSFNITTNSGESNDRILHLQAGKIESFSVIITNLNKINTKYELIYDVCSDSKCNNFIDEVSEIKIQVKENYDNIYGNINIGSENAIKLVLITENNSNSDYYIKLNMNAGYAWNDLARVGKLKKFSNDINLIAYVDGEEINDLPNSCNYSVTTVAYKNNKEISLNDLSVTCDKTTKIWKISYSGFPTKIKFYFSSLPSINLVNYIQNLYNNDASNNYLSKDDPSSNIRYFGGGSKNYIEFGNDGELWRIIGIFNVNDSSDGIVKPMVKIVRNSSIGTFAWDTTFSSDNSGYGYNDWTKSKLMQELNNDYLNYNLTSNSYWYSGVNNAKSAIFNFQYTIKEKYQKLIANVTWNLGGYPLYGISAADIYSKERSSTVFSGNSSTWIGKIGLLYPSDIAYASDDSSCRSNISKCSTSNPTSWMNDNVSLWLITHVSSINNYVYAYRNGVGGQQMAFNKYDINLSCGKI